MTTPYVLEFELKGLPDLANNIYRGGFKARNGKSRRWKLRVAETVGLKLRPPDPLQKARLTLTRYSHMRGDWEGRVISFKPIIDGLVEIGVLVDDNDNVIVARDYFWEKAKMNEGKIKVKVEEVA